MQEGKWKVSQYMGNSFKDFRQDYDNLSKNLISKFKHTGGEYEEDPQLQKEIGSEHKTVRSSWNSQQLDNYLQKSQRTVDKTCFNNSNKEKMKPLNGSQLISSQSRQTLKSQIVSQQSKHSVPSQVKESFFFTSIQRFRDNVDTYKLKDYKDQYSDKNFLVCERKDVDQDYFKQHFEIKVHPQEKGSKSLSMCYQQSNLMTPSQKLDQMLEMKQKQKEFQAWKTDCKAITKRRRVHKGMYPSGILQVDNPYNQESELYEEEAKMEQKRCELNERFKKQHMERIAMMERSNPQIEFMNSFSQKRIPANSYHYSTATIPLNRFQNQYNNSESFNNTHRERISVNWNSKRPVSINKECQGNNTGDRLFGAEAKNFSISRAKNLRMQETKNRNFNPISCVDNIIEFKQDQGIIKQNT